MSRKEQTPSDVPHDALSLAFDAFMVSRRAENLADATLAWYRNQMPRWLKFVRDLGVTDPNEITSDMIRRYMLELQARGLNPGGVHNYMRQVKTFCRFCYHEGYARRNAFEFVKMPKLPQEILPAYSAREVKAIIKACLQLRDRAIVLFLLDTGVRASELCALKVGDIDMATGSVFVRKGKGGKDRMVYLGGKAHRALVRYWNTRDDLLDGAPCWMDSHGKGLQYWGLRQLFYRLEVRSGVHITAHAFRRTFAIEMLRNGCDVYSLQRLMGHADLTVLRRYLDLVESDLEKAHRKSSPVDNMKL